MLPMYQDEPKGRSFSWRSIGALLLFVGAILGFELGVGVSERPEILTSGILTKAYYSLSLFVVGGVDLGVPYGGPLIGRVLVWFAYFGAPILAAWTLVEAILRSMAPQSWQLRRLKDHIIIVGEGPLAISNLRVVRKHNAKVPIVVVSPNQDQALIDEFNQAFSATVVTGDITHEFFLKQLRVKRARKVLLLDNNSLRSYEAASAVINLVPVIAERTVVHCANLRFMRAMENTSVARRCQVFNAYQLAASGLVRTHLLHHFRETRAKDVVVLAGFGRFGQTILEELQRRAVNELDTVVIMDLDVQRRVLVAEEQMEFSSDYQRQLFEGDIAHPEVWDRVRQEVNIRAEAAVFVLGTGREEDNLRTALWLRQKYPEAMIIARSRKESQFATEVGQENDILSISITQLVEDNIPTEWITVE
jgi:voltage-gated potassium channel Kch